MPERERLFWLGLRKALIEMIKAIEVRYGLETALINNEQRKMLRRLGEGRPEEMRGTVDIAQRNI